MADADDRAFPEKIQLQSPRGFSRALDALARERHRTRSQLVRDVLEAELKEAGIAIEREQVAA